MPDINLALNTFNAPSASEPDYSNEWENYEYILRRLGQVADETLVGLHAHLYPDVSTETATAGLVGPWKDGLFRLFISHTKANKQLAGEVSERLLDYGIDAFVAHDVIEPTKEWMDEIEAALATCDSLAAVLTEDFVSSKWCDQEIGYVVARGILIVAVRQGADPHGFISKYQAVPGDTTRRPQTQLPKAFLTRSWQMVKRKIGWHPRSQRHTRPVKAMTLRLPTSLV